MPFQIDGRGDMNAFVLTFPLAGVMLLTRRQPFFPSAAHDKFFSICTAFGGYTKFGIAPEKKRVAAELHLHSDQGFQYTSQAYFNLTKSYGITPSMSRRGNPYDNAMAENFFSILKTECIYRHKPATFSEANEMIDRYIHFYNHERIQFKTGEAPLARRLSY